MTCRSSLNKQVVTVGLRDKKDDLNVELGRKRMFMTAKPFRPWLENSLKPFDMFNVLFTR